ncbi:phosphatase PAP2 family protein [Thermochromatium tepidum]|uniref:undecaprenyl-diphosphate phosphatase n=1 Tax=Thermochromatium tepidum ATCC 43061 TaxID=316276 RepID=A0A6I6EBN7_THETI|nr:phosphatase PAP2 family protein [Thermochromatium tepidum]QGU31570.1 phosphatase PAP2 family protein [Thermochromatium tepidum ATCC 43061]
MFSRLHPLIGRGIHWVGRFDLPALWRERLNLGMAYAPIAMASGERWLLRWAGVGTILGLGLYLICGYHAGFPRLNVLAAAYPSWIWACLTALGDERALFALTLFFSLRRPRLFWTLILSALIAIAASRGLKVLLDTARPPAVLAADAFHLIGPALKRMSFPSGHSVSIVVFCGVLMLHTRWIEWRVLLLLIALLVGASRVAVGAHWPIDVIAGLTLGALSAWLGGRLALRWTGPASRLDVHLTCVVLAAVMACGLLFDDGGYAQAALMQRLLALGALASAIWSYIVGPLVSRKRATRPLGSGRDFS